MDLRHCPTLPRSSALSLSLLVTSVFDRISSHPVTDRSRRYALMRVTNSLVCLGLSTFLECRSFSAKTCSPGKQGLLVTLSPASLPFDRDNSETQTIAHSSSAGLTSVFCRDNPLDNLPCISYLPFCPTPPTPLTLLPGTISKENTCFLSVLLK